MIKVFWHDNDCLFRLQQLIHALLTFLPLDNYFSSNFFSLPTIFWISPTIIDTLSRVVHKGHRHPMHPTPQIAASPKTNAEFYSITKHYNSKSYNQLVCELIGPSKNCQNVQILAKMEAVTPNFFFLFSSSGSSSVSRDIVCLQCQCVSLWPINISCRKNGKNT